MPTAPKSLAEALADVRDDLIGRFPEHRQMLVFLAETGRKAFEKLFAEQKPLHPETMDELCGKIDQILMMGWRNIPPDVLEALRQYRATLRAHLFKGNVIWGNVASELREAPRGQSFKLETLGPIVVPKGESTKVRVNILARNPGETFWFTLDGGATWKEFFGDRDTFDVEAPSPALVQFCTQKGSERMEETPIVEIKRPAPAISMQLLDKTSHAGKCRVSVFVRLDDDAAGNITYTKREGAQRLAIPLPHIAGEVCVETSVGVPLQFSAIFKVGDYEVESERTPLVRPMLDGKLHEDYRHTMQTLLERACVLEEHGRLEEALDCYAKALAVPHASENDLWNTVLSGACCMCNALGKQAEDRGDLGKAFEYYERSTHYDCRSQGNPEGHAGYVRMRARYRPFANPR